MLVKADTEFVGHPAVTRAQTAAEKATKFEVRPKLWIQKQQAEKMVLWCGRRHEYASFALLSLFSYDFLLRLPSKAFTVLAGPGQDIDGAESVLCRMADDLR